jgi:hypothetical protein
MQDAHTDAAAFLRQNLAAGPQRSEEIKAKADAAGISAITLRRARERLGVVAYKGSGFATPWYWKLPDPSSTASLASSAEPQAKPGWRDRLRSLIGSTKEETEAAEVAAPRPVLQHQPRGRQRLDRGHLQLLDDMLRAFRRDEAQLVASDMINRLQSIRPFSLYGQTPTPLLLQHFLMPTRVVPRMIPGISTSIGYCKSDIELALGWGMGLEPEYDVDVPAMIVDPHE